MDTELKPCPFCGGEARLTTHFSFERNSGFTYECLIKCERCPATMIFDSMDKNEALAAWNRRAER